MSEINDGGKLPVATLELPAPEELKVIREALEKVKPHLSPEEGVTLDDLEKVTRELLAPFKK